MLCADVTGVTGGGGEQVPGCRAAVSDMYWRGGGVVGPRGGGGGE